MIPGMVENEIASISSARCSQSSRCGRKGAIEAHLRRTATAPLLAMTPINPVARLVLVTAETFSAMSERT